MMNWQYWLLAGLTLTILLVLKVWSVVAKRLRNKQRDFDRKLETVLKPKEEVLVIHKERSGRWILTNQRLLRDTKAGLTALPIKSIKTLSGITAEGKKTVSPAKMDSVTIKADKEIVLHNTGDTFVELVTQLKKRTDKKKK